MNRRRLLMMVVAAALSMLSLPAGAAPTAAECSLKLRQLEARLRAAPDDLFLGADYRQVVIACDGGERATRFFDGLAERFPDAANALLNAGFAHVDRIPPASDIRQALLGRAAAQRFGRALELKRSWVGLYTRGFIHLFYPRVFRTYRKAVADLEAALALQQELPRCSCHARTYAALGDAYYWRLDDLERARRTWAQGLSLFPGDEALRARVTKEGMPLRDVIRHSLSADVRIDTSLRELREPAEPARVPAASASPP